MIETLPTSNIRISHHYNYDTYHLWNWLKWEKEGKAIPICPEQLGGLQTPRNPAEIKIVDGKKYVIDEKNNNVTENFEKGAKEVLEFAKKLNIKKAILQARSPSCGTGKIYSGNFDGKLIQGNGILAELLIKNGIEVISSEDYK